MQGNVLWRREDTMDMQDRQKLVDRLGELFVKTTAKDESIAPEIKETVGIALTLICEFMADGKRIADALERQNALTASMLKQQGFAVP